MELICRPLETWPRDFTSIARQKCRPFRTGFEQTRRKLMTELRHLETTTVIIQVALPESAISATTGWPRGDKTPTHPGVIVAADTKHGALKWLCDDCMSWTDNVHAIALTLERLRLADLYGVTRRGEQYAGWKMLPGPITAAGGGKTMSIDEAARVVAGFSGWAPALLLRNKEAWQSAYRVAAKKLHADARGEGENSPHWKTLQDAAQLLNGLHNRK